MNASACVLDHGDRPAAAEVGYLCRRHCDQLRDWLIDITDWYLHHRAYTATDNGQPRDAALAVTDPRIMTWNDDGLDVPISTTRARYANPLTGRLESNGDDVPDVTQIVDTWSQVLSEEHDGVTQPSAFAARLELLRRYHSWMCAQPWVDEYRDDIVKCQRALAAAVGEASGPVPFGDCPYCSTSDRHVPVFSRAELERWAARREGRVEKTWDRERAECDRCRRSWEGTEVARLRLMQEAG